MCAKWSNLLYSAKFCFFHIQVEANLVCVHVKSFTVKFGERIFK